jgi:hypothetical protein
MSIAVLALLLSVTAQAAPPAEDELARAETSLAALTRADAAALVPKVEAWVSELKRDTRSDERLYDDALARYREAYGKLQRAFGYMGFKNDARRCYDATVDPVDHEIHQQKAMTFRAEQLLRKARLRGQTFTREEALDECYGVNKDCKAWIAQDAELCATGDCRAYVLKDADKCDSDLCKAYFAKDPARCGLISSCKAFLKPDPNVCNTGDCDAFFADDALKCTRRTCQVFIASGHGAEVPARLLALGEFLREVNEGFRPLEKKLNQRLRQGP